MKHAAFGFFIVLFSTVNHNIQAQDTLVNKNKGIWAKLVDAFIDKDINRWSVRLVSNYKDTQFTLRNGSHRLNYTPTNRSGVGFGVANSKLVVDVIINLKTNKENPTQRTDIQGNLLIGQTMFHFAIQDYIGFNVDNTDISETDIFREDIRTASIGLSGIHIFNDKVRPLNTIYSGKFVNYQTAGSFLLGGYFQTSLLEADSSIIPESSREFFNDEAEIVNSRGFEVGINAGYSLFAVLPANFFLALSVAPGIGLSYKNVETQPLEYSPNSYWGGFAYAHIAIGYNSTRIYAQISNEGVWYHTNLDNGNRVASSTQKFKAVLGWKFKSSDIKRKKRN
jgi:hypothetical protein